jgi:hypothetical protein
VGFLAGKETFHRIQRFSAECAARTRVLEEEERITGPPNAGQAVRRFIHQNDKWG